MSRSGMTRSGIASRVQRLEQRLGFSNVKLQDEQRPLVPMQWEQFCALFGKPIGLGEPPPPLVVLKDARLVRWLRQVHPERLKDLKQAHAAGEPAAPWQETSTRSSKRKRCEPKTASADLP